MLGSHKLRWAFAPALASVVLTASLHGQTAVWVGGFGENYTTAANWQAGVVPANTGSTTLDLPSTSDNSITVDTNANVAGLQVQGSGYVSYNFYQGGSHFLTIGTGGISLQAGAYPLLYLGVPVVLSANQTWHGSQNGYIYDYDAVSGPGTLTVDGRLYLTSPNTYTGGTVVDSIGTVYAGDDAAFGTGAVTLQSGAAVEAWEPSITIANPTTVGSSVSLGGTASSYVLTFSGPVTLQASATTLNVYGSSEVIAAGTVSGPPSSALTIQGAGSQLPGDGGSLLVIQGALSQVTGIDVEGAALILAPTGSPIASFSSVSSSGLQVGNTGPSVAYLGLDGTFTTPGAVSAFLSGYGAALGASINGTLGFDTIANPSDPNVFNDAINLSAFTSAHFTGLGSASAAVLGSTAVITPAGTGNAYLFGGGGGMLTVVSPLADYSGTQLVMNAGADPLTLLLQGTNTYSGGTTSNGGVLIFDSPLPTGTIHLNGGYVGYTENATNIGMAQDFVGMIQVSAQGGIIGFDSTNIAEPRSIADSVDLSAYSSGNNPFIGTATNVTLTGTITPAGNEYQFTGVKGGRLTVSSTLADSGGPTGVTIGLLNPIETNGGTSVVNLTATNTYTGTTTINSGALFIDNNSAFGTGVVAVPDLANTPIAPYLASYGGGTVTIANPISIGSINSSAGLTVGNSEPSGNDMLVLNGVISDYSGPGILAIDGPVTLGGTNTYTGGTILTNTVGNAPYVVVTNSSSLGAASGSLSVEVSSTLVASANVALPNTVTLDNGSTLTLGHSANPYTLTLSGVVSGNGGLDIESVVDLTAVNTYTGGTFINNTTVVVGSSSAFGSGPVTLANSSLTYSSSPTVIDLTGNDSSSTLNLLPSQTLTLDADSSGGTFDGNITGDATDSVVKIDTGTQILNGNSTYGGGTAVNAGTLIAGSSGALGTGAITVANGAQLGVDNGAVLNLPIALAPGATLSGSGTFSPPGGASFASGTTVMAGVPLYGQYISTLSFGTPVTLGTGGIFDFNVADASGAAGTGYSTLAVTGALTITATPGSPFTINVISITPGAGPGPATFNPSQSYSWTILTAGSIPVFNSSDFAINTAQFQNSLGGGSFALGESGSTLTLDFTPVPEPSEWMLMAVGVAALAVRLRRRARP